VTKITKRETIEGELGRFMLHQGEEPQAMYNRLKTLVNQVRNLRSTKWDDHEMVKVILRSLVFLNPTQVQLIRGDPRYTLMSPEEVSHPVLEGKPNANYIRARIRTHVHSDYINEHHRTVLE
jgi:hypothetical protein